MPQDISQLLVNNTDELVLSNVNIAPMQNGIAAQDNIQDGALAIGGGVIQWLGQAAQLPSHFNGLPVHDCAGQWLLPGFIDCHTHLVFAGSRAHEFEMRLQGKSYEEIAQAGGGIVSTVAATRAASKAELLSAAIKRARAMLQQGVTVLEIKSGYGLDLASEIKMLEVAREVGKQLPIDVKTTFLGAHAVPPEFKGQAGAYINYLCQEVLPAVHHAGLADAVDVFCESIGFDLAQSRQILDTACELGLPVKAHVEQLNNLGGSEMAASLGALSVDHIEYLDETGVAAIASAGTVATLLPGAFYFLRETQKPPIDLLRKYKVPMAIATDFNPGSSPLASLPLMLNMACTFFGLTPEEVLLGVTKNAAKALGVEDSLGTLAPGKQAKMVLWDICHPRDLCYEFGIHQPSLIVA